MKQHGFALVETLVALVLLGVGLLGAAATLLRGQIELRATLLTAQAAELAGDMAEQLRAQPTIATRARLLAAWQAQVQAQLPGAASEAARGAVDVLVDEDGLAASHTITLLWLDPALNTVRRLELPVLLSTPPELP
jgi:prepilin-type N-terminal cleavage/methylation domain-containing protein